MPPLARSNSATPGFLHRTARPNGITPLLSRASIAAPASSSASATSTNPRRAAICNGVARVTPPHAFTSAPAATSSRTTSGPASPPHPFATAYSAV